VASVVAGSAAESEQVYDRLASLVPPPEGGTRQLALQGDRIVLSRWWDSLGIETGTWWRILKRQW
jgi:hypothetical protein